MRDKTLGDKIVLEDVGSPLDISLVRFLASNRFRILMQYFSVDSMRAPMQLFSVSQAVHHHKSPVNVENSLRLKAIELCSLVIERASGTHT